MTPRFVVAQAGHTGSKFTSRVLTAAGIPCGHESFYGPRGLREPKEPGLVGDSTWCVVPWLDRYGGIVYHQMRDPLKVVRSMAAGPLGGVGKPNKWSVLRQAIIGPPDPDPLVDVVRCVVAMNDQAAARASRTWRVEDFSADHVLEVAADLDIDVDPEVAAKAVESVPTDTNRHRRAEGIRTWDDLPYGPWVEQLRIQAERYGYA